MPYIVDGILSIQEFLMSDQLNVDVLQASQDAWSEWLTNMANKLFVSLQNHLQWLNNNIEDVEMMIEMSQQSAYVKYLFMT